MTTPGFITRVQTRVFKVEFDTPKFFLDGQPVSTVYVSGEAPTPGSVSFDMNSGIAHCNVADNGKTLSTSGFTAVYYPNPSAQ